MSVDSTALERSALERKDRDELVTIAKALGGKPPARAKKADIVDLVLELTGVGRGASPPTTRRPAPARAGRAREPARRPTPEEPPAEWEVDAAEAPAERGRPGGSVERRRGRGRTATRNGQERPAGQGPTARGRARAAARTTTRAATAVVVAAAATAIARAVPARRRRRARGVHRRADRRRGPPRPPRRGLRLPPDPRLPAVARRRVRVGEAGAAVRAAQGRPPQGRQPSRRCATRRTRRCCASTR